MLGNLLRPTLQPFLDKTTSPEDARYILFGAPMDETASYRSGSRFAPGAIRRASTYMETYSLRTGLDWGDLPLADAGDLAGEGEPEEWVSKVEETVSSIRSMRKTSVMLGGEHTVTLGALRALKPDLVVVLDAHMDLRDTLFDERLCHATHLRRAYEELDSTFMLLGPRALSEEEVEFARGSGTIRAVTSAEILRGGAEPAIRAVRSALEGADSAYLSIDMDVIDPAQAPAVGNPSPEGIGVTALLDMVRGFADGRFLGFDLTEVTPHYDSGLTSTQAAYITLEALYSLESAGRG